MSMEGRPLSKFPEIVEMIKKDVKKKLCPFD